jgi:hypothetical protein
LSLIKFWEKCVRFARSLLLGLSVAILVLFLMGCVGVGGAAPSQDPAGGGGASSTAGGSGGASTIDPAPRDSSFFYGPGLGADALGNTVVGGPFANEVSYRFRARHSGPLQDVHIYLIPDRAGYAAGTGGQIRVSLYSDDGSPAHNPSTATLASSTITHPLVSRPARYFPTLTFQNSPALVAGQLYHLVFSNTDASPSLNYLSVDDLYQKGSPSPGQPSVSDLDWAVLVRQGGKAWGIRRGYTPILELDYQDGWSGGTGYIEAWAGTPQTISGAQAVRETFTVTGGARNVASVAVRIARIQGSDPLDVRLESADGTVIDQGSISAREVPLTKPVSYFWERCNFPSPQMFFPGKTYHLDLEANPSSAYQAFPIRKGSAYGFHDTTFFPDGVAQFKQGNVWVGWTQWGATNRQDGDLQFYFSLAP